MAAVDTAGPLVMALINQQLLGCLPSRMHLECQLAQSARYNYFWDRGRPPAWRVISKEMSKACGE
jgi:hypothetical protein